VISVVYGFHNLASTVGNVTSVCLKMEEYIGIATNVADVLKALGNIAINVEDVHYQSTPAITFLKRNSAANNEKCFYEKDQRKNGNGDGR